jgi:hypothetical protein
MKRDSVTVWEIGQSAYTTSMIYLPNTVYEGRNFEYKYDLKAYQDGVLIEL